MMEVSNYNNNKLWDINLLTSNNLDDIIKISKICIPVNPAWKLRCYNNNCSFTYLNIGITSNIIAVYEKKNDNLEFNEKYYITETREIYYNKNNLSEIDKLSIDAYNSLIKL